MRKKQGDISIKMFKNQGKTEVCFDMQVSTRFKVILPFKRFQFLEKNNAIELLIEEKLADMLEQSVLKHTDIFMNAYFEEEDEPECIAIAAPKKRKYTKKKKQE